MTEWSDDFWEKMKNRMEMSYYKYGSLKSVQFTHRSVDDCRTRLRKYEETGNTEWLVDAANYCMIEFMYPNHKDAHFRATDSHESPGIRRRK